MIASLTYAAWAPTTLKYPSTSPTSVTRIKHAHPHTHSNRMPQWPDRTGLPPRYPIPVETSLLIAAKQKRPSLKPTMAERVAEFDSDEFKKAFNAQYDKAEKHIEKLIAAEKARCEKAQIPYTGLKDIVFLDIDETTLSNAQYYRDEIAKGADGLYGKDGKDPDKANAFDQKKWDTAITGDPPLGEVIPRAKKFIDFLEKNGIRYAYMSGRSRDDANDNDQLPPTQGILKKGGMMGDNCLGVFLKADNTDASKKFKDDTRDTLCKKHNGGVLLCIGDQPSTDFCNEPGKNILLPNPFYRWDVKSKEECALIINRPHALCRLSIVA